MFVFNWHFACLFVALGFQICLLVACFLDICSLTTYSTHTRNNCSSKSFVFLKEEVSHPTSRRKNAGCHTGWVWHFTVAYIDGRTFVQTVGVWRHNQNFSHKWVYQNLLSMGLRYKVLERVSKVCFIRYTNTSMSLEKKTQLRLIFSYYDFFNVLLGVWISDETHLLVFDIHECYVNISQ